MFTILRTKLGAGVWFGWLVLFSLMPSAVPASDAGGADPEVTAQVRALEAGDRYARFAAASKLGSFGSRAKGAVLALARGLNDPDPEVRLACAKALGEIGAPAVPLLTLFLRHPSGGVRTGVADALGHVGRPAVPSLIEALKDQRSYVRLTAASAIMQIGPDAAEAVPALLTLLRDPGEYVRPTAVMALGSIGPSAKEAVPELLELFDGGDEQLRQSVALALGGIGPEAGGAVHTLARALKDADPTTRVTAAAALGRIGASAEPAVPSLVTALGDEDEFVRSSAAFALGGIGQAAGPGVPALTEALRDRSAEVRRQAAESLAGVGPAAVAAVPALVEALQDPDMDARARAAAALADIAAALQDAGATDAVGDLTEAGEALSRSPEDEVKKHASAVRRSIAYLELLRRGRIGAWLLGHPIVVGAASFYPLLLLACLLLLWRRPVWLLKINEALSPYADVRLPLWPTGPTLPLRHAILVGFFHHHPRVLDAWVAVHVGAARRAFERVRAAGGGHVYAPAPVALGGEVLDALSAERVRPSFAKNVACLLVLGEGGAGKTTIAGLIAEWAMAEEAGGRLCPGHLMLPVFVGQAAEFPAGAGEADFLKTVGDQLRVMIDEAEHVPLGLLRSLLKRRRILLVIDGLSEMTVPSRQAVLSAIGSVPANAVVITSRNEEPLGGMLRTEVRPLKIRVDRLFVFVDAYLAGRDKRELFDDEEYLEAGRQLLRVAGERDVTPLLAKLFLEQMIARKEGTADEEPPENIPDLMLRYLTSLCRYPQPSPEVRALVRAAEAAAWACVREHFRPAPAARAAALGVLLGESDGAALLDHLEGRLRVIETAGAGMDLIRFTLDPLCEYLAGLHLVHTFADDEAWWLDFLRRVDDKGDPEMIKGFLLAVRDCCEAAGAEASVLQRVAGQLVDRLGIDAADRSKLRVERRARRFLRELRLPDAEDRLYALNALREMYAVEKAPYPRATQPPVRPDAGTVMPALTKLLGDEDASVRRRAAGVIKEVGPAAKSAVVPLIRALVDPDRGVRMGAALALGAIGPDASAAVPALVEALFDEAARVNAAQAIGQIGPAAVGAAPALAAALKEADEGLRTNAAAALGHIGPDAWTAVEALTGALADGCAGVRMNAAHSLALFGRAAEPAVQGLVNLLKDDDKYVRLGAARALASLGGAATARDALFEMSRDADEEVRRVALYALRRVGADG